MFTSLRGSVENHTGIPDQNDNIHDLFSNENSSKTIPFGAIHNERAYIGSHLKGPLDSWPH